MAAESDTIESGSRKQMLMHGLLLGFVLLQLTVPLTYYLRSDVYDERFAWRMFSAVRLQRCQTQVSETTDAGTTPLRLGQELHQGWIGTLRRNRISVVESFLTHRCKNEGVRSVVLVNRCNTLSAGQEPIEYTMDCSTHTLSSNP